LDLQANDPAKLVRQLTARAGRIQAFNRHLKNLEAVLSDHNIKAVFDARAEVRRKSVEAARLREATFPKGLLPGTGTDSWAGLWEAARRFSQETAYPGKQFPVVAEGAKCVLCQQGLDHATQDTLGQFEQFVASAVERELRDLRADFAQKRKHFTDLKISTEAIDETLNEARIEHEAFATATSDALMMNARRLAAIVTALADDNELPADCPVLAVAAPKAESLLKQIEERVKALSAGASEQTKILMESEVREFRARKLLEKHLQVVLDDIERRKQFAAYGVCIDETKTTAITAKSTAVTKTVVSQKLKKSFQSELDTLAFRHVEVELKELGGTDGVFYHKLVLSRAPGVELPKVVSEGEQRCLSIAAFFAELSTADDPSGIVFDDPVSSLDFQWRNGVARRLVEESKTRQVIVFTHDVVFLLALRQLAPEEVGIEPLDQHVHHLSKGAGVCVEELPWVALPVKQKIGYLNKCWQAADKLSREGHKNAYEKESKYIYGLLREAWERAVEEVLLCKVVERYRPGVQTLPIAHLADISPEDCKMVETAMSRCSTWLPGHDQAAAARAPVPAPTELKADIDALAGWVSAIRKRRNS
jgi:hypothetical protein